MIRTSLILFHARGSIRGALFITSVGVADIAFFSSKKTKLGAIFCAKSHYNYCGDFRL